MSAATMPSAPTPVTDGLFTLTAEGPRLLGSRCASCATVYFPKAISCRNPVCRDKAVSDAQLPSGGTLFSYTIQHYRPPPLFRDDDWKPYAIGVVELGEGLQVMGMLDGVDLGSIAIGMPLRLVTRRLYHDAARGEVVTYAFAPDDGDTR